MRILLISFISGLLLPGLLLSQGKRPVIDQADFSFLQNLTRAVMDSARLYPGQALPSPFGKNNTGGVVIRPGGRDTYPAFWIRDYTMSLESGLVTQTEQKHMLLLTAQTQCDHAWITQGGSIVPVGSIADHIRVDDRLPIYFPGTYDYTQQGTREFGVVPPYDDQFYFILMACYYVETTNDTAILFREINGFRLIDRLEIAFGVPPSHEDNAIVYTSDSLRGVDFGFRDAEKITGDLSFTSILKYLAAKALNKLFIRLKNDSKAIKYRQTAAKIKKALPEIFLDHDGLLLASTARSGQPDVWATAFAIYHHLLKEDHLLNACRRLAAAYDKGTLSYQGNIRHILRSDDYNDQTAWQSSIVPKNRYQNGAYWGTPVGWVAYAIQKVDPEAARKLVKEYIAELRQNDFRKGGSYGAPFECFYPPDYKRGPVYLTSVSCPYIVFKNLLNR